MKQDRLVQFGFLLVAILLTVGPALVLKLSPEGISDYLSKGAFSSRYFIGLPWLLDLPLPIVSSVFAVTYWAGSKFGGLTYRAGMMWWHLGLWTVGALTYTAPVIAVVGFLPGSTPAVERLVMDLFVISTVGYCVTLLSAVVFAICIGDAILRRIRRKKAL